MRKLDIKTTTFETGHDDFLFDIVEFNDDDPIFETWLYRANTGTKIYVIGEYKKDYPGMTVTQYAKQMMTYINPRHKNGANYYDVYDEQIEANEISSWERIKAALNKSD